MWSYESERPFNVYDYLISHGQLLIRSDKNKGFDDNIDIIFFSTDYIQIPTYMRGLSLRKIPKPTGPIIGLPDNLQSSDDIYQVESERQKHYVVAGFVRIFSNQLDLGQSSLGFEESGRENVLTFHP